MIRLTSFLLFVSAILAPGASPKDLCSVLEPLRVEYHIPACACAIVENGHLVAMGATGVRNIARPEAVTPSDIWHIGSCTKSLTASVVGMLVDDGKLRWDLPVAEALPHVSADPAWSKVTVWDLVTQQSGLGQGGRVADGGSGGDQLTTRELRVAFARELLARPPGNAPGKFAYSNSGYGLLGSIIEQASHLTYEEVLRERIFKPLDLRSAGFGAPATPGKVDQPWGHRRRGETGLLPVAPTAGNPFPTPLAPAACVHMTLQDFARYATWLSSNDPPLLRAETAARLQTPPEGSDYAGGVWKTEFPGRPGSTAFCHTGNLGGFFAVFYTSPEMSCVTVFNLQGGGWEWLGDVLTEAALKAASEP